MKLLTFRLGAWGKCSRPKSRGPRSEEVDSGGWNGISLVQSGCAMPIESFPEASNIWSEQLVSRIVTAR